MKDQEKTTEQLISELEELRREKHERKQTERVLRQSEEKLRNFIEQSLDGITLINMQGIIVEWNRAQEKITGLNRKDVIGHPLWDIQFQLALPDFKTPEMHRQLKTGLLKAIRIRKEDAIWEGRLIDQEIQGTDGMCRMVQTMSFRIVIEGEAEIGVITRDITDQKKAEEALKKERDFAQSLVETAQAIVLVLDINGRIVNFNPYMQRLSGYSLEEVKGKDWFSTFLPKSDYKPIRKLFKKAVGNIQTKGNINPIVLKSGQEVTIEWYDKTLKDAEGNIIGVLAIGLDITDRKQAEEEREKLISDLQTALAKIKTLSGIIPICAKCKKIRDDKGFWEQVEVYIRDHTEAEFSHGLCPECAAEMEKEIDQME